MASVAREAGGRGDDDTRDTRTLILQTAEELFIRHGYAAVSMKTLVEEVSEVRKLSKPAIYYHFADKETLFVAVVRALCERLGRDLEAAATTGDAPARVRAVVTAMCRSQVKNFPRLFADADEHLRETLHSQFGAILQQYVIAPLERCFARLAQEGALRPGITPPIAIAALIGLVAGFSFVQQELPPTGAPAGLLPDAAMLPDIITDLLLRGIGA